MRRALTVASALASVLLVISCQKSQTPQAPAAEVADAKSCLSIVPDQPFLAGTDPTQKGTVQIGEKLALLGQSRRITLAGKERDYVRVRRDTGAEGWVRSDYVVSNAILAVVTTGDAIIYGMPRNTAATTVTIPRMTVLAIHADSGGLPFIRVSWYDTTQKTLQKEVYLRNEGVSARPDDVQAAILLQLAAASKSPKQQQAFITSAIKDYPASLFMPQLQDALTALQAPPQGAPQSPAAQAPLAQAGSGQPAAAQPAPGQPGSGQPGSASSQGQAQQPTAAVTPPAAPSGQQATQQGASASP